MGVLRCPRPPSARPAQPRLCPPRRRPPGQASARRAPPAGASTMFGVRPASSARGPQRACAHAAQVRVVCSSGGHFARQASGNLEYEGGETRLVSVANFCSLADLQARALPAVRWVRVRVRAGSASPTLQPGRPAGARALRAVSCAWFRVRAGVESAPVESAPVGTGLRSIACALHLLKRVLLGLNRPAPPCVKAAQWLGGYSERAPLQLITAAVASLRRIAAPAGYQRRERAVPVTCGSEAR